MSYNCKGLCYKNEVSTEGNPYAKGKKYCSTCEVYILSNTTRCICCNNVLRIVSLRGKSGLNAAY